MKKWIRITGVSVVLAVLGACGGGSGGGDSDVDAVETGGDGPADDANPETPDEQEAITIGGGGFDGSRPSVTDLYSESQLQALEDIGMQINFGDDPPNVEGAFRIEPAVLQASANPEETIEIGTVFATNDIEFSNQDADDLTLDFFTVNSVGNTVDGSGSFISGSGSAFTVYFVAEAVIDGFAFDVTETYSGVVTDAGLESLQYAVFVVDDRGDPMNIIIPTDAGRLFLDGDGFSPRLDGPADDNTTNTAAFDPLLGDFIFTVNRFDGGFFSYRATLTEDDVLAFADGQQVLIGSSPGPGGGVINCEVRNPVNTSDPSYFCRIVDTLSQVATLFTFAEPGTASGTAFICSELVEDCGRFSPTLLETMAQSSPTGNASVQVTAGVRSRSAAEVEQLTAYGE